MKPSDHSRNPQTRKNDARTARKVRDPGGHSSWRPGARGLVPKTMLTKNSVTRPGKVRQRPFCRNQLRGCSPIPLSPMFKPYRGRHRSNHINDLAHASAPTIPSPLVCRRPDSPRCEHQTYLRQLRENADKLGGMRRDETVL